MEHKKLLAVLEAAELYIKENPERGYYNPERKHAAWEHLKSAVKEARTGKSLGEAPEKEE